MTLPQVIERSAGNSSPWRSALRVRLSLGLFPSLVVLLVVAALLGVGIGAVPIGPDQVVAILLAQAGIETGVAYTPQQQSVLLSIRLPRVLLAGLIGAGLAMAGATLQGIFRNPLAEPAIIGVSSGAAVGAVASIVFGLAFFGIATLPFAAFLGGVVTTLLVYVLARHNGRTEVVTLILTGIAINAIASAFIGFMTFLADDQQLRNVVFWTLGGLGGTTWPAVLAAAPMILLGLLLMPRWAGSLDLMVLGENEARHLGVSTERLRIMLVVLAAMVTGAGVAVAGIVGFVGLVVPHTVRLLAGPGHRVLLPASALFGASLLIMADLAARMLVRPAELPLGVLTALVGGPFFLWLLHRTRRTQGGWA